jgi:hypothetical protein
MIMENPSPREPQCRRQLPDHLLIVQPEADQVPMEAIVILKSLPAMQNPHIVYEAHIPLFHCSPDFVLFSNEMDCI